MNPVHLSALPLRILLVVAALLLNSCAGSLLIRTPGPPLPEPADASRSDGPAATTDDLMILSIDENGFAHLFAFQPPALPLTRLTSGAWNDTGPAVSPDGKWLAFASDRSGYWDLHLLDLESGEIRPLTDTQEYDAAPTWSPDGQWIAFESYLDDNLDVAIMSVDAPDEPPILLTHDSAADHSPAWSPDGRRIAFVSARGRGSDVWLADLDLVDAERFHNVSNTQKAAERYPAWSPDGQRLLWSTISQATGFSGVYLTQLDDGPRLSRWIGDGARATFSTTADSVVASLTGPNQHYLAAYDLQGGLELPPVALPGIVRGLTFSRLPLPHPLPRSLEQTAQQTPTALWAPAVTPASGVPSRRWYLVDVDGVEAPNPQLHDLVDESFAALRRRVLQEAGWDALSSLENAFVPLSSALDPGRQEDWLFTGRAFAMNSLMSSAGWMIVVREDFGAQTYWRVYLRCTLQDGSLGEPVHDAPWDLEARYELNPRAYEEGGRLGAAPPGYWVDITALAAAFGWERLPALPNWRSYYAGTRFTEFAQTAGLDWYDAMLELYPPDVLVTPTRVLPPTNTPTRTPRPTTTPLPTRTPRATLTPSVTPTASNTPLPTSTPPTVIP